MPYPGIPKSKTGKMERCIEAVMRQGNDKSTAIAICHTSIAGKKEEDKYYPPKAAQENAKRALRWREEYPDEARGGTRVGWTRASQLASGEPISFDIVKRIAQFNRHRKNAEIDPRYKGKPWKDNGYLMWLAWGGIEGVDWAMQEVEKANSDTKQSEIAERIAERVNRDDVPASLIQSDIIDAWKQRTMGTPASDRLQKTIAKTFGHSYPAILEKLDINWSLLYAIGEIYNITQEALKAEGYSEQQTIPVYHTYVPTEARPKQWKKGDEVRIKLNPATSWTINSREAIEVAQFLGSQGSPAFVLKTFVPMKSIISTPQTGFGEVDTGEVVLAGGEYEALVEHKYG